MTTLQAFAKDLKDTAGFLPKSYNDMTVEELANGYCVALDAEDEFAKSAYFSGLYLKFWYLIDKLYKENGNALKMEREDFIDWISGAIIQACNERPWQKNNKLKVQQVIQQILATRFKAAAYYESNLQINKANFGTESLDSPLDDDNDNTLADILEADKLTPLESYNAADALIQKCLDDNKVIEAIITETIAYNDCEKHENKTIKEAREDGSIYKYTKQFSEFWPYRVVSILSTLSEEYKEYFKNTYKVNSKIFDVCFDKIKNSPNKKLYEYLDNTKKFLADYI